MPPVPRSVRRVRLLDRLYVLAALLAWVGQLAVLGAPLLEAGAGRNAAPHVEAQGSGNPLHHAHTPELCPGCAALALVGRPESARSPLVVVEVEHDSPVAREPRAVEREALASARPRAPPVWEMEPQSVLWFTSISHTPFDDAIRTLAVRAHAERGGHRTRAAA